MTYDSSAKTTEAICSLCFFNATTCPLRLRGCDMHKNWRKNRYSKVRHIFANFYGKSSRKYSAECTIILTSHQCQFSCPLHKALLCHEYNRKKYNLLKPTGYVMHQQVLTFNNCTLCPYCIYEFCIYLRTNSNLCHLQHKLIGFYNRDEKCLQRGTDWVFK